MAHWLSPFCYPKGAGMKNDIKLCDGITFENLNPLNFALKNAYISNLFSTGLMIIPRLAELATFTIEKGFLSKQYINDNYKEAKQDMYRHGEGLALEIRFDVWDKDGMVLCAHKLYQEIDENIKVEIDCDQERFRVYRDVPKKMVLIYEDGKSTLIAKD